MMSDTAFDLFQFLNILSRRDQLAYEKLTPEAQKSAAPFVIQRWLSGTSDAAQIVRINTFVNPYVFALGQDKALLFKLLAAGATGKTGRYFWIKAPGSKGEKLQLEIIKQFYGVSTREANEHKIDAETALEMAVALGWDDEELKKLKKELT